MPIRYELIDPGGPLEAANMTYYCEDCNLKMVTSQEFLDHAWEHGNPAVENDGTIVLDLDP